MRFGAEMELAEVKDDDDNSDHQSSSLSVTDSDGTSSQDSEDSLELSESESITDVTPLNSPYCDSPLPHVRSSDLHPDSQEEEGSINVLTQAIKKLEVEQSEKLKMQSSASAMNCVKKKTLDSRRRMDADSQRLLKHVMSQQNRAKANSAHDRLHRRSTVINRHRLLNSPEVGSGEKSGRSSKSSQQKQARQMKCLSHPSSSPYSYGLLESQASCSRETKKTGDKEKAASPSLT